MDEFVTGPDIAHACATLPEFLRDPRLDCVRQSVEVGEGAYPFVILSSRIEAALDRPRSLCLQFDMKLARTGVSEKKVIDCVGVTTRW